MNLYLYSIYVCHELSVQYETDAFKYKFNWRHANNGKETRLDSLRAVNYQLQMAIL